MYGRGIASRVMACLLALGVAGGFVLPCRAQSPEARQALAELESAVLKDLTAHLAYLALPHKLSGSLNADGVLKLRLVITTTDLRQDTDVRELAVNVGRKLAEHMATRWPRLAVDPESTLSTKRPFSFTEALPDFAAPLSIPAQPRRKLTVATTPAPRPSRLAPPIAAGLVVRGPSVEEVELRNRIERVFRSRWILTALSVRQTTGNRARAAVRMTVVSQGLARDRQRLRRATQELSDVLRLQGVRGGPEQGSEIRFDLKDAQSGQSTGGLLAAFREGHWRIDGEDSPDRESSALDPASRSPAALQPAARQSELPSLKGTPNAGGLPPVTERPAVSGSIPEQSRKSRKNRKHPPVPPIVDDEQSGAHRPVSTEDLIAVPESVIARRGSSRARTSLLFRRIKPATYSNRGQLETVTMGTAVSVATARRVQATFAYQHPWQDELVASGEEVPSSGDAVTFSLKYQTPPALRRHAHLAVGADLLLQSRRDEAIRLPDDYAHADSFWATYNIWASPISLMHLMIRRVGVFTQAREYTQVALAHELLAHHPIRRAYWELVADDRVDKAFGDFGRALAEPVSVNVGVEFELGRTGSLQVNIPRLLSGHYRQGQLVFSVGI